MTPTRGRAEKLLSDEVLLEFCRPAGDPRGFSTLADMRRHLVTALAPILAEHDALQFDADLLRRDAAAARGYSMDAHRDRIAAEAKAERLTAALEKITGLTWTPNYAGHMLAVIQEIARAALAREAAPAQEGK